MKFRDLDESQKNAYQSLLQAHLVFRQQETMSYIQQFYRLLVLGNGAGIVLLASFMGAVSSKSELVSELSNPLVFFSIGSVLAAIIYFPLMAVANQSLIKITEQQFKFYANELDLKDMQGYGFSKKGIIFVFLLKISSLICFSFGLYKSIKVLHDLQSMNIL